jgi:agmatinase
MAMEKYKISLMDNSNKQNLSYDPNAAADPNAGIYGLPYSFDEAKLVYLPIPWEATTSYGGGTVFGPEAIINASPQMDVFDLDVVDPYALGLHCLPIDSEIVKMNDQAKKLAQTIKDVYGDLEKHPELRTSLDEVNALSAKLNQWTKTHISKILKSGKIAAVIGGDHSTPFGAFEAAAEHFGSFGILHFDAHSDTRNAYMGFEHSHASIIYNAAIKIPAISQFVQVGIRDFCDEEYQFIQSQGKRFNVFFDQKISEHRCSGKPFAELAQQMISTLPQKVWVSFDIDGLDPRYCPHTGTPVPGGLDYSEAVHILRALAQSGREIIGFDVVEVAPILNADNFPIEINQASDEWDANVGMRLIYKLSALAFASQKLTPWRK